MALIANPISISPKFHRHMGPLAPQSPSARSLARNQSSTIDGSRISPPSQLVFTTSQAIAANRSQQKHDSGGRSLWCSLNAQTAAVTGSRIRTTAPNVSSISRAFTYCAFPNPTVMVHEMIEQVNPCTLQVRSVAGRSAQVSVPSMKRIPWFLLGLCALRITGLSPRFLCSAFLNYSLPSLPPCAPILPAFGWRKQTSPPVVQTITLLRC